MSEVKRYDVDGFGGGMIEIEGGAWYHMDDYEALEAERADQWRLRREAEADRDTAKAVAAELRAELAALKGGQEARRDWPDDDIVAAWKWCEENGGTPAEFLSYSLLGKRSRVLGRPLTWREAIELTHATTDMPDEQRDKLLAMDDAPPAQASAWVAEGWSIERTPDGAFCLSSDDGEHRSFFASWGHKPARAVSAFLDAMLAAAPTPGASDGKGVKP